MKPQCEVATQAAKSSLEAVREKKTKLSLNQKKSKLSTQNEVPKKQSCLPLSPVSHSDKTLIEYSKDNTEHVDAPSSVGNGLATTSEENATALHTLTEEEVVAAAFSPIGESLCPICEKSIPQGASSDHWKNCLQKFKPDQSRSGVHAGGDVQEAQYFICDICQKDLTHMNKVRRNQHVNRCIDSCETSAKQQDDSDVSWNCPFCGKVTVHTTRVSHLRRCGMRQRVPFQKLMEIRHVLDRQLAERQQAGIPLAALPKKDGAPKTVRPRTRDVVPQLEPRSAMDADLQMGVALSASLKEHADRRLKAELEEMGMAELVLHPSTSSHTLAPSAPEARRRKKGVCGDNKKLPLLLVRTAAERQSIIASKVQSVVLEGSSDEEEGARDHLKTVTAGKSYQKCGEQDKQEINEFLSSLVAKEQPLLKLAALSNPGDTDKSIFYMTHLHPAVTIPKPRSRTKQFGSSLPIRRQSFTRSEIQQQLQIKGKDDPPEDQVPSTQDAFFSLISSSYLEFSGEHENNHCLENKKELLDIGSGGNDIALNGFCLDKTVSDGFVEEELPLSPSFKTQVKTASYQLLDGLASMVGNKDCSDVLILTNDGEALPAHRLVLYIRCKKLYQELLAPASCCSWPVSLSSARYFLTYLYTGCVDGFSKEDEIVREVQVLANSYNVMELASYCDGLLSSDKAKLASPRIPATHSLKDDVRVQFVTQRRKNKQKETSESVTRSDSLHKSADDTTFALGQMSPISSLKDKDSIVKTLKESEQCSVVPNIPSQGDGLESKADLPESECVDIISDCESPPACKNPSPEPCITMDDSSSSLWSHNGDMMELEKPCSANEDPALLGETDVSIASGKVETADNKAALEDPVSMHDVVILAECKSSQTVLNESNSTSKKSLLSGSAATVAETTMNDVMSTTTELFEQESFFTVPNSVTYQRRQCKTNTPLQSLFTRHNSDAASATGKVFDQLSSPSDRASTSTPLPQTSGSGCGIRATKFYSVSSIEASPSRRVHVSSRFERSASGCSTSGFDTDVCARDTPSSPQSPVFLSSNTKLSDMSHVLDKVEDSLSRINKVRKRRPAHCISFNSDSENEVVSPSRQSPTSPGSPACKRCLNNLSCSACRQSQTDLITNSFVPPPPPNSRSGSHRTSGNLTSPKSEASPHQYQSPKCTSPRTPTSQRAASRSDCCRSLTEVMCNSSVSSPKSTCCRLGTPNEKVISPGIIAPPKIRNHDMSQAGFSLEDDIWEGFDDDGGFNIVSPGLLTEQLVTPEALNMSSPLTNVSPRKRTVSMISPKKIGSPRQPNKSQPTQLTVHQMKPKGKTKCMPSTPVTPAPAYDVMTTPEISVALKKYGVRQFPRKKAIPVLKHIYEETHPLVTDSEHESSFQQVKEIATQSPSKAVVGKSPNKKCNSGDDDVLMSSQSSNNSSMSSAEIPEESYLASDREEITASQEAVNVADVSANLYQYFTTNTELRRKILTYEPLNIADLQAEIKAVGIKCSMNQLMDFLDEQCITFSMGKIRRTRRRQRKPKNSPSPKRRKKNA